MKIDDVYIRKYEETSLEKLVEGKDKREDEGKETEDLNKLTPLEIKWHYLINQTVVLVFGFYGLFLCYTEAKWQTIVLCFVLDILTLLSITAGAHRLWSHRTYKAKLPLRIFLAVCFTMAHQESIFTWVLNHRVHHKYTDTNADPHNAKRGFWYSHILWIVTQRTEDYRRKVKTIDMSDVKADPVVRFQWKYFYLVAVLEAAILPFIIPIWFWGESVHSSFCIAVCLRLLLSYHKTFLVNSFAHKIGCRPYDAKILPTDNLFVSLFAFGEGFHNYHHTFPWDYKTSEYGLKANLTTPFIDLMAWLGLATDRKTAPKSLVETRKRKTEEESLKYEKRN